MTLRVRKNGHYSDCLLSSGCLITDINVKCQCGRPLPTTLGCAIGRVYCGKCYRELCHIQDYNPGLSQCLNRRLDRHEMEFEDRMNLDIETVEDYISGVGEHHFHADIVNRYRAEVQKQKQIVKWQEALERADYWRENDPGSYHESDEDDSIVDPRDV